MSDRTRETAPQMPPAGGGNGKSRANGRSGFGGSGGDGRPGFGGGVGPGFGRPGGGPGMMRGRGPFGGAFGGAMRFRSRISLPLVATLLAAMWTPAGGGQSIHLELTGTPGRVDMPIPPDCSTWHELYPDYCIAHHIDAWEDNGDGIVSPCDMVWLSDQPWHIEDIGFNIIVTPDSSVEPESWSRIKQMFRTLFGS